MSSVSSETSRRLTRGHLPTNVLLVLLSVALTFVGCELLLRIKPDLAAGPPRFLFWSLPAFETNTNGVVHFSTRSAVREIAVYNGVIEYDMVYATNNEGWPDTVDYGGAGDHTKARTYIFLGDSFAAGSGGFEWIPALRHQLIAADTMNLYNFSIPGGGIWHHLTALKSVKNGRNVTDIIILAISDDLSRPYWRPVIRNNAVWFRSYDSHMLPTRAERFIATGVDFNAQAPEILRAAAAVPPFNLQRSFKEERLTWTLSHSRVLALGIDVSRTLGVARPGGLVPLKEIRTEFPNARMSFVHLPQKDEVYSQRYKYPLRQIIESMRIAYYPCLSEMKWSVDMFHTHDSHPNELGYWGLMNYIGKQFLGSAYRPPALRTVVDVGTRPSQTPRR
jgi:hypothetical protein